MLVLEAGREHHFPHPWPVYWGDLLLQCGLLQEQDYVSKLLNNYLMGMAFNQATLQR